MENDEDISNKLNDNLDEVFNFDYEKENIKENKEFQKWKSKIEKIYGKNYRIYKCNKDKICFYGEINTELDYYMDYCPKCKKKFVIFVLKS